jgi:diguanylate cyclase (GGDEF)-like protein
MVTAASDDRLRACLDVLVEGVAVLDAVRGADGQIVELTVTYLNPEARHLQPGLEVGTAVRADSPGLWANVYREGVAAVEGERSRWKSIDTHADGDREISLELIGTRIDDDGLVVTIRDVTERRATEARLAWAATHDPLTGLANRPLLVDRLGVALARRPSEPPNHVGVLFIDLDGFKIVNDELGHAAGDATLVEVARRLTAAVRPADTVARFGGDEFVVLTEALPGPDDARQLAERLADAVAEVQAGSRGLQASVGVALAEAGDTPDTILRMADQVMYDEKRRRADA